MNREIIYFIKNATRKGYSKTKKKTPGTDNFLVEILQAIKFAFTKPLDPVFKNAWENEKVAIDW